jgi:taurine dioxygenase
MVIESRPLTEGFGAEVIGVDLTENLSATTEAEIREAWIAHGLLLFRNHRHDDEALMRFSRIFGDMEPAATAMLNDAENPYIMTLKYDPNDANPAFAQHYNIGGIDRAGWLGWHWDQAFMPTIVRGAVLRMVEPASRMGETGFVDGIGAYDRLSDAMKKRIDGLEIVYEFNPDFASGQFGFPDDIRKLPLKAGITDRSGALQFPAVVHPLVITQRETGRKVLKLSPMHARYVLDMDRNESDALLQELALHLVDPAYAYFHSWQANDMVVWDNWRMVHSANGVPIECPRYARRTTITGDYEVGRYLDAALDRDRKVTRIVD